MRVTVVATGLGQKQEREQSVRVVVENTKPDGKMDYKELEKPAISRAQQHMGKKAVVGSDMDFLDIPAFLRKQAD